MSESWNATEYTNHGGTRWVNRDEAEAKIAALQKALEQALVRAEGASAEALSAEARCMEAEMWVAALRAEVDELKRALAGNNVVMERNRVLEDENERLEALSDQSICIFCHATMPKTLEAMIEHAKECEQRPENRLMRENEKLTWMLRYLWLNHVYLDMTRYADCLEYLAARYQERDA